MINFFLYTSPFALLFPLIICLKYTRQFSLPIQITSVYVFCASFTELVSTFLWLYKKSNLFLLHAYTLIEFLIISIFYLVLFKPYLKKWILPGIIVSFLLFAAIDSIFFHNFQHFNVFARALECLIIISYAIYYLSKQLSEGKNISLQNNPIMQINTAFLFYFSVSFFLFLFSDYISHGASKTHIVWMMHALTLWIYYTTIGIALWKAGRK